MFRKGIKRTTLFVGLYSVMVFILGMLFFSQGYTGSIKQFIRNAKQELAISTISNRVNSYNIEIDTLGIQVDADGLKELTFQRELAITYGGAYRTHELNKGWVSCSLIFNQESFKAKVRLKGGQLDHFGHEYKWSFKVKMKGEGRVFGMKKFAIQQPFTRGFLNEPVLHWFLNYNGLISLKYFFVAARLNDRDFGVYMIEENMHQYVMVHNKRREGIIFSINDDMLWHSDPTKDGDVFSTGQIEYNGNDIEKSAALAEQFNMAKNLFEAFRLGKLRTSEVFDVKKMSMMFAITDLFGHHHATYLYNLKFYYNPITSLIEPICYDNQKIHLLEQPKNGLDRENKGKLCGEYKLFAIGRTEKDRKYESFNWHEAIFSDTNFYTEYFAALKLISSEKYFTDFLDKHQQKIDSNMIILHRSFPTYSFDKETEVITQNAKYIRRFLRPKNCLNAYYKGFDTITRTVTIAVLNTSTVPLRMKTLRVGKEKLFMAKAVNEQTNSKESSTIVPQGAELGYHEFTFTVPPDIKWKVKSKNKLKVDYSIFGSTNSVMEVDVLPFPEYNQEVLDKDVMRLTSNIRTFDFIDIDEESNQINFLNKEITIDRTLHIPKGYQVNGLPGLKINLINGAEIISRSPFNFVGNEDSPILVYSSNSTGAGLLIIDAPEKSTFEHVNFIQLSNISNFSIKLPGAITCYRSDVTFESCLFKQNVRGDDLLNLVNCQFEISDCKFKSVNADAFDGDFVTGKIIRTTFDTIGNDAIDISGSSITISDVLISNVEDKAISAGEASKVLVDRTDVTNVELAFTSKDLSEIIGSEISVTSSKVGFVGFKKKPEFGSATIRVSDLKINDVDVPFLIETGSSAFLDGEEIRSEKLENVKNMLYGKEYGKKSVR